MKRRLITLMTIMLVMLTACSGINGTQQDLPSEPETDKTKETKEETTEMRAITMTVNGEKLEVKWEDNESVRALAEMVSGAPLEIDASMYGGFEQVGAIGTTLPSNDVNITTDPGDIVLYTGSNIVVFFGSNTWDYTKLGHIENRNAAELKDLLGGNNVKITFSAE